MKPVDSLRTLKDSSLSPLRRLTHHNSASGMRIVGRTVVGHLTASEGVRGFRASIQITGRVIKDFYRLGEREDLYTDRRHHTGVKMHGIFEMSLGLYRC